MMRGCGIAVCVALICLGLARSATALSDAQCSFFQVAGRTAICHVTPSAHTPFVLIDAASQACAAHANHPFDFVAVNGSCDDAAPLPEGAPCDATLACAEGLSCRAGVCAPVEVEAFDASAAPRRTASAALANFWTPRHTGAPLARPLGCVETNR